MRFRRRNTIKSNGRYGVRHPAGAPEPRRDLQLDALVELLDKKRAVHIHSYRADEILMFARLAKELWHTCGHLPARVGRLQVADAIRDIGAGGSTFSDWWAYKWKCRMRYPGTARSCTTPVC